MCKEVFEIVQEMNMETLDTQLVLQCAPVISGLKISNLLIVKTQYLSELRKLVKESALSYCILGMTKEKVTIFLYNDKTLQEYLDKREVRLFLKELGYDEIDRKQLLRSIRFRYMHYLNERKRETFPHELGITLGYPVEDVRSYIQNNGKNGLYEGYWKVYHNVEEKRSLFLSYEAAKESMIRLLSSGQDIHSLLHMRARNACLDA